MTDQRRQTEEIATASTLGELFDAAESPTKVSVTTIYGRRAAVLGVRFEPTRYENRRDRGDAEYVVVRLKLHDSGETVLTAVGGPTAVEQLRRWQKTGELPQNVELTLRGGGRGVQWWKRVDDAR